MSAEQLIQSLSWAVFLLIFVIVTARAVRQPRRVNVDIALFFSVPALVIGIGLAGALGIVRAGPLLNAFTTSLVLTMVYLLLRLVGSFSDLPDWLGRGAPVALGLLVLGTFAFEPPRPLWLTLLQLLYAIGLFGYAAIAFVRASQSSRGVTRRRLAAVAVGCVCLGLVFIAIVLALAAPQFEVAWRVLTNLSILAASISYYIGFAPPLFLRRAWQEPELRAFLSRTAQLSRLDTPQIVRELERSAAEALGAPNATIGLWDEAAQRLRFTIDGQEFERAADDESPASDVYRSQRPLFVPDVLRAYPTRAASSRVLGARAVLAAPITADNRRRGVLIIYTPHPPIFAEDDLGLIQLLADQAAILLESRALMDEAARVQAREEATRLKDDFLSAAAHDLKTPLTTLLAKAQQLERRARRSPDAPADLASIQLLVQEAQRLRRLVLELLDAARAEQGRLVGERTAVDIAALAQHVAEQHQTSDHRCVVSIEAPVIGMYDPVRIEQLFENLIENALKYSPAGGNVEVRVWSEGGQAHISVSDQGIGIPASDLAHIFDRFYRASNVNDRQFAGMGLGLFICRGIVEQHGGQIAATSTLGSGTTFHVTLPLAAEPVETPLAGG